MDPIQSFKLKWKLSNYPDKAFVKQLITICCVVAAFTILDLNLPTQQKKLASTSQKPDKIDTTLQREFKAGRILGPLHHPL